MSANDVANQILATLESVPGLNATLDSGKALATFPNVIIGVPELTFGNGTYNTGQPSDAVFHLYLVVASDPGGYALPNLEAAIGPLLDALWTIPNVVVTPNAVPGTYHSGGVDLPAYIIVCEASI